MTLGAEYFDELYATRDDPWRLAVRWYESRKRAVTLSMLPRRRFSDALELGCSIGVLTEELAARCDRLDAVDIAEKAVRTAQVRLRDHPNVTVECRDVTTSWPDGARDLIVVSEMGYYLERQALEQLARRCAESLTTDGVLLTCHWRHPVTDYPLSGDETTRVLRRASGLSTLARYEDVDVTIELLGAEGSPSVAAREGLLSSG